MKKQIIEKEGINLGLRQDLNEANSNLKNLMQKLKSKEDEHTYSMKDIEIKFADLEDEKNKIEEKLTQIVDIVKQQSKELYVIILMFIILCVFLFYYANRI